MQSLSPTTEPVSSQACAAAILDSVPHLIWYVRRHMRRHRKGLSVPAFRTLIKVECGENVSLSCVAEHLGASLPTSSRIVAKLVQKGFLTRCECPHDRRQIVLCLTPQGKAITEAARQASIEQMTKEFGEVPAKDREAICRAMEILSKFLAGRQQCGVAEMDVTPISGRTPRLSKRREISGSAT